MRAGLLRVVVALLFASVAVSSSNMSAQSSPPSSSGSATSQPASANAAPVNTSSGTQAGTGAAPADDGQPKIIGGGVSAPVLIKQVEPQFSNEARQQHAGGTVTVNMIVDQNGLPQNIHVIHGAGMGLDENAVKAVKQYRFKPARENGKPVSVYLNVEVKFETFENAEEMRAAGYSALALSSPADRAHYDAELGSSAPASGAHVSSTLENASSDSSSNAGTTPSDVWQPKNVGGGVTGPVVIKQVEPQFSDEARQKPMNATVTVSLIVDQRGMPQNVHVTRGVGMGLDENAVKAVKKYRFKPAMENGKPVAVYLNVEVLFAIFDKNGKRP